MLADVSDVSVHLGGRWVLSRLSFGLPEASSTLLTGENGAGKTTLLRLLATTLQPTLGTLRVFGLPTALHRNSVRARIGLFTHHSHLYEALTALENLALCHWESPTSELWRVLERVGLAAQARRPVAGFSAGMRRRLGLARLLLRQPALALLDEPFGQLDPGGVALMQEVIKELQNNGTTLLIASHDIERASALCTRHLTLTQGRMHVL